MNNTKTNICFIANYTFTYLFHEMALTIQKDDIETFWIVNNQKLYDFLKSKYDENNILYISRKDFKKVNMAIDDFKLNELIYGDRVLRLEPQNGLHFLENIQKPIYDFLLKHKIRAVVGELTWAHEILVHRMCKIRPELDCTFLNPHVARIPDDRFVFFTDEAEGELFEVWQDIATEVPLKAKKPDYLKLNDASIKKSNSILGRLDRIKRFFSNENIDKNDPTLIVNQKWRFKTASTEEINRFRYREVKRSHFDPENHTPYVFLGLHKQPESSVDVFGRYYEDQMQNIKNIWRALPQGWQLLIKEHTNAIGDRSPAFYNELKSLPGLVLIDETINSYEIIRHAKLVATITGTIAYEAALMGVPSITFSPVFFTKINSCRQITLEDLYHHNLEDIAQDLNMQKDNRLEFTNYLLQNSFKGKFYDPNTTEISMRPENIKNISAGLALVVKQLTGIRYEMPLQAAN